MLGLSKVDGQAPSATRERQAIVRGAANRAPRGPAYHPMNAGRSTHRRLRRYTRPRPPPSWAKDLGQFHPPVLIHTSHQRRISKMEQIRLCDLAVIYVGGAKGVIGPGTVQKNSIHTRRADDQRVRGAGGVIYNFEFRLTSKASVFPRFPKLLFTNRIEPVRRLFSSFFGP